MRGELLGDSKADPGVLLAKDTPRDLDTLELLGGEPAGPCESIPGVLLAEDTSPGGEAARGDAVGDREKDPAAPLAEEASLDLDAECADRGKPDAEDLKSVGPP